MSMPMPMPPARAGPSDAESVLDAAARWQADFMSAQMSGQTKGGAALAVDVKRHDVILHQVSYSLCSSPE